MSGDDDDRPRRLPLGREAIANIASRPGLALVVLLVVTLAPLISALVEANSSTTLAVYQHRLLTQGYATLYLTRDDPNAVVPLTAGTCSNVARLAGVRATMWLQPATRLRLWNATGSELTARPAGGDVEGFLSVANQNPLPVEPLLLDPSSVAADPRPGQRYSVRLWQGDAPVAVDARSVELNALGGGLDASVLVTSAAMSTERIELCAALVSLTARNTVAVALAAGFPSAQHYVTRWAMPSTERLDRPADRFIHRTSQYAWLAGTCVAWLTWALYLRIRRPERLFYAINGLSPRRLLRLVLVEQATYLVAGGMLAATIMTLAAQRRHLVGDPVTLATRAGLRTFIATALVCTAYSVHDISRPSAAVLALLKDR